MLLYRLFVFLSRPTDSGVIISHTVFVAFPTVFLKIEGKNIMEAPRKKAPPSSGQQPLALTARIKFNTSNIDQLEALLPVLPYPAPVIHGRAGTSVPHEPVVLQSAPPPGIAAPSEVHIIGDTIPGFDPLSSCSGEAYFESLLPSAPSESSYPCLEAAEATPNGSYFALSQDLFSASRQASTSALEPQLLKKKCNVQFIVVYLMLMRDLYY